MPVLERAEVRAAEREEQQIALEVEVALGIGHLGHQVRRRRLESTNNNAVRLCANQSVSRAIIDHTATPSSRRRVGGVEAMMQPWRRRDNLIYALPFAAALSLAHWP